MMEPTLNRLTDRLRAAQRIALILHVSPDGDTCGSVFALRRALLSLGKEVTAVCDHKVPHIYDDLDGAQAVVPPEQLQGRRFDLSVAIDVADRQRMGRSVAVFDAGDETAQIDHHGTNPAYAGVNYLQSPLSATAVLVLKAIDALNVSLDQPMAKCLYVAVATDTGNFKQQNTDAQALETAARCLATGLDPAAISRRVFDLRPLAQLKLIACALESLTVHFDGRASLMTLEKGAFRKTGALSEHTEGIINFGINAEGVQIACLLSQAGDTIKGSFRSLPPYDVARIATALGGGGHEAAAGCTLDMPMPQARDRVLEEIEKELARHG